ncbi:APC family permease [Conexibacter sp. SYSU D00693]|uniref:APC family permease n=1 Tax=Conexibacter sp. SYSU D00693 TaxID=2812560 RepID=UPI00196B88EC|nr:APC family permease [Conexibacter sp. SYSU D00693]
MSTVAQPAGASALAEPKAREQHGRLSAGALGLPSVLFCIVTGAAPLAAMMFNVPITVLGGGFGAPAAFLIATVVLTIFSVGYIEMSRRVTAAGGFYTFVTRGLGPVAGLGCGILIAFCYIVFAAAVMGSLGYFTATSFEAWFGIDLPGYVYTLLGLAVISAFGWFHIELTAKVLGVALVAEVLALTILAVGVLVAGGDSGLSLSPINPVEVFDNEGAIQTFGAAAAGVALFGAFWSWVGFEMAPNYAEESRDPKRIAKAATYGSVIGLGIFYVFISWVFVMGWGTDGVAPAVNAQFEGEYGSAFYPLTDRYVGGALTTGLEVLVITSSFACAMAFYNTAARYLYSLSRERILPAQLGRTHPDRHSPYFASMVVTAIVGLYVLGFTLYDSSTEASLLKLGTWSPLLGVLGILAVQAIASFAILRYFLTAAKDGFHWFKTLVAPVIGGLAQVGACWLLIDNRGDLAGDSDVFFVKAIPWLVVGGFLVGVVMALWLRSSAKDVYAEIGAYEHDDPQVHEPRAAGGALSPVGA